MKINRKNLDKVLQILESFDISTENLDTSKSTIKLPNYVLAFIKDQFDKKSLLESNKNFKKNSLKIGGTTYLFEKHGDYYYMSRVIPDDYIKEGLIKRVPLNESHLSIFKDKNNPTKAELKKLFKKLDCKEGGFFL